MDKKRVFVLLLVLTAVGAFFFFDLGRYFNLESLKANQAKLTELYAEHTLLFVGSFVLVYIVQTALSLPGAAVLTLAGGAVFGSIMGTVYVNIGASTGATLAFLVARFLLRDWIVARFGSRTAKLDQGLRESGLSYLLFLRLVPVFPFWLINLASGITGLPLKTYVLGTVIGILPGSFVFANAGASLATIDSMSSIASPRVIGSFVLLGLFALVPTLYQKRVRAQRKGKSGAEERTP
jgi:uncharacterized membrane protein YdjX (TVP38/TMEM64 family)